MVLVVSPNGPEEDVVRSLSGPIRRGRPTSAWPLRAVTALLTVAGLFWTGLHLRGAQNPDWEGYEQIYKWGGSWLSEVGRDPLFTRFMDLAFAVFGPNGYEDFRFGLLSCLVVVAGALVLTLPPAQRGNVVLHELACLASVFALLCTKATIQVREGMAIMLVAAALVRVIRPWTAEGKKAKVPTYTLLVCAALVHAGTAPYLATFLVSHAVSALPKPSPRRLGVVVVAGLAVACVAVLVNGHRLTELLSALTLLGGLVIGDSGWSGAVEKYMYWSIMGVLLGTLSHGLMRAAREMRDRTAIWFTVGMAAVVLPSVYMVIIYLLTTGQPLVFVSFAARLLSTAIQLALLILVLRGSFAYVTAPIALFSIVDQIRIVQATLG